MKRTLENRHLRLSFLWMFLSIVLTIACFLTLGSQNPIIRNETDTVRMIDFAYYALLTRSFWLSNNTTLYSLETQHKILSEAVATDLTSMLPLNVLPTAFIVFLPLVFLVSLGGLKLAYSAWTAGCFALLIVCLVNHYSRLRTASLRFSRFAMMGLLATIFSGSMHTSIILGQTSVLISALLILLVTLTHPSTSARHPGTSGLMVLALFVLSMKPQFFAIGVLLVIANGYWRVAFAALGVAAMACAALTPALGAGWLNLYLKTLSIYGAGGDEAQYGRAIAPELMNTFRSVFSARLGEQFCSRVSYSTLLLGFGFVGIRALQDALSGRKRSAYHQNGIPAVILIGVYLLFSPHSGIYEDVSFLVPLSALAGIQNAGKQAAVLQIAVFLSLVAVVDRYYFLAHGISPVAFFGFKAACVLGLLMIGWTPSGKKLSEH